MTEIAVGQPRTTAEIPVPEALGWIAGEPTTPPPSDEEALKRWHTKTRNAAERLREAVKSGAVRLWGRTSPLSPREQFGGDDIRQEWQWRRTFAQARGSFDWAYSSAVHVTSTRAFYDVIVLEADLLDAFPELKRRSRTLRAPGTVKQFACDPARLSQAFSILDSAVAADLGRRGRGVNELARILAGLAEHDGLRTTAKSIAATWRRAGLHEPELRDRARAAI